MKTTDRLENIEQLLLSILETISEDKKQKGDTYSLGSDYLIAENEKLKKKITELKDFINKLDSNATKQIKEKNEKIKELKESVSDLCNKVEGYGPMDGGPMFGLRDN